MTDKVLHHASSTIVRGICVRGLFKIARQRYVRQVFVANIISSGFLKSTVGATGANIVFSQEDALRIIPCEDNPLVITVQHSDWEIMCVLIDPCSSAHVLFWYTIQT